MNKLYISVITLTLGMVCGITLAHTAFAYDPGWYTLFNRHHCSEGDNFDGGCFCNNPNDCQIQFTGDQRTDNIIMQDIIKSQGNGHFIPDNLRDLFNDLQNSQQNGDFGRAFHQCLELKDSRGLDFSCRALITQGAANINPQFHEQQNEQPNLGGAKIIIIEPNGTSVNGPLLNNQLNGLENQFPQHENNGEYR